VLLLKGTTTSEVLEAMKKFTEVVGFVWTVRGAPGSFRGTKVRAIRSGFTIKFLTMDSKVVVETYNYAAPESGEFFSLATRPWLRP
jgi:hypothetical protein